MRQINWDYLTRKAAWFLIVVTVVYLGIHIFTAASNPLQDKLLIAVWTMAVFWSGYWFGTRHYG